MAKYRAWRVEDGICGFELSIRSYAQPQEPEVSIHLRGGTMCFCTGDANSQRLDQLIIDLIAAREHAFGPWRRISNDNVVDLRPLLLSLKDQTQSRSEFARCEAALSKLEG